MYRLAIKEKLDKKFKKLQKKDKEMLRLTLLLHKDSVELTGHYHKKSVSSILIISYKRHHLINPADDIDLRVVP